MKTAKTKRAHRGKVISLDPFNLSGKKGGKPQLVVLKTHRSCSRGCQARQAALALRGRQHCAKAKRDMKIHHGAQVCALSSAACKASRAVRYARSMPPHSIGPRVR